MAAEIERRRGGRPLELVDIGGGLSSTYREEKEPAAFSYSVYRERLEREVPELFTGRSKIITEFGRSLFLKVENNFEIDFINSRHK